VPEGDFAIPLGTAAVVREGTDVTMVGLGHVLHQALDAARALDRDGISAEVIDLRSIAPLDRGTVRASVAKTGRLVVADDDYLSYGLGAEIIASVCEDPSIRMRAAPVRIAFPDIPVPFTPVMEHFVLPNADKIAAAVRPMMAARR
jgi:pyruvate dehydrogenase E1 component beta subunit